MWYNELDTLDLAGTSSYMQDTTTEIKNEQEVLVDEFEDEGEEVATEAFDRIDKLLGSIKYLRTKGKADHLFMVMYDQEAVNVGYPSLESFQAGVEGFIGTAVGKIKEWFTKFFEWLKNMWKKFWRMFGFYKEKVEKKTEEVKKTKELPDDKKKDVPEDKWVNHPTEIEKIVLELEKEVKEKVDKKDTAGLKEYVNSNVKARLKEHKFNPKKLSQNEVLHLSELVEKMYKFASSLDTNVESSTKNDWKAISDGLDAFHQKEGTDEGMKELQKAVARVNSLGSASKIVDQAMLDVVKDAVRTMDEYLYVNNKEFVNRAYRDGSSNKEDFDKHMDDKDSTLVF